MASNGLSVDGISEKVTVFKYSGTALYFEKNYILNHNLYSTNTKIFSNLVNTMSTEALAPCVTMDKFWRYLISFQEFHWNLCSLQTELFSLPKSKGSFYGTVSELGVDTSRNQWLYCRIGQGWTYHIAQWPWASKTALTKRILAYCQVSNIRRT